MYTLAGYQNGWLGNDMMFLSLTIIHPVTASHSLDLRYRKSDSSKLHTQSYVSTCKIIEDFELIQMLLLKISPSLDDQTANRKINLLKILFTHDLNCSIFFTSCASYQQSTREFRNSWDQGNEVEALANLEDAGKDIKPGHDEELLWNLEMSSVLRSNQLPEQADYHLGVSKTLVDENFGGGFIKPQQKGLGEYVGKFHDRNMLEIYRACRFLELGEASKVQAAFTELRFKREEARELNLKKIQDAESKAYQNKNLKYKQLVQSGEVKVQDFVNIELSNKYSEFYNPMGDYLRLVLKNRTNKNLDFGASEANLKQALGPRKKFLMKETLGNQDPVIMCF